MFTEKFQTHFTGTLEKVNRRVVKRWGERAGDMSELGAVWNGYSLLERGKLGDAVEKVGQAVDAEYLATAALVSVLDICGDKADYSAVASLGEYYNRTHPHLRPIRRPDPFETVIPSPKACSIRARSRGFGASAR